MRTHGSGRFTLSLKVIDVLNTDIAQLKTALISNISEMQKEIGNISLTLDYFMNNFTGWYTS